MTDILILTLTVLICVTLGGLFIELAVDNFKAHRYFLFGFDIMIAVYNAAWILKLVFEH